MSESAISDEKVEWLRKVLDHVRFKHRVTFTRFAKGTSFTDRDITNFRANRRRADQGFYDAVIAQAAAWKLLPSGADEPVEYDLLDVIKVELDLDKEKIEAYSSKYKGQYTLFLRISDDTVSVCTLSLMRIGLSVLLPNFTIWRPDVAGDVYFKGYYYENERALQLIGNESGTAFPRFAVLNVRAGDGAFYFDGRMFGSTRTDEIIFIPCIAFKEGASELPSDRPVPLDRMKLEQLKELVPAAHAFLANKLPLRDQRDRIAE